MKILKDIPNCNIDETTDGQKTFINIQVPQHMLQEVQKALSDMPAQEHTYYSIKVKKPKIIAIASGKGGVGKSTTAFNIALALSQEGIKTGILDADIYGPSIPTMLKIDARPDVNEDKKMIPIKKFGLECMSIGFLAPKGQPIVWRGPMVHNALKQMLFDTVWQADVIIIDMPPGTGDPHLTLAQEAKIDGVIIVTIPHELSVIDAEKSARMFQKLNIPILGIVENMSGYNCCHCNQHNAIFGEGGSLAKRLDAPILAQIPLDPIFANAGFDPEVIKNYHQVIRRIHETNSK